MENLRFSVAGKSHNFHDIDRKKLFVLREIFPEPKNFLKIAVQVENIFSLFVLLHLSVINC
jgi:hypothetical protein